MVSNWSEPKDPNNPRDVEAAERVSQLKIGWFSNPIFGNGDYPAILKAQMKAKAKELGLPGSPLPVFTEAEKKFNRGWYIEVLYQTSQISTLFRPIELHCKRAIDADDTQLFILLSRPLSRRHRRLRRIFLSVSRRRRKKCG
jgi:hypothetical protein